VSHPIFLPPGKTLGLFSPAGPSDVNKVRHATVLYNCRGYEVVTYGPSQMVRRIYLAGTDERRLESLTSLLEHPEIDAYLARRGGFGSARLLPDLGDWSKIDPAKPIIGFSDITALHLARYFLTGVGGWHAPLLGTLYDSLEDDQDAYFSVLAGKGPNQWEFSGADILKDGVVRGPVLGGNLSVLWSLAATPYWPSFEGAILLLEEKDEVGYRLDRLLTSLYLSGVLNRAAGLVFGSFMNCGNFQAVAYMQREAASRLRPGCPAVKGAPFGHRSTNRPWWVGEEAELMVKDGVGTLKFLER
jgi:muramoyltetrapeptide carboxypeptidase